MRERRFLGNPFLIAASACCATISDTKHAVIVAEQAQPAIDKVA
jgi:hypothetical protein